MVADPEIAKRLTYKMINRNMPTQLRLDPDTDVINTTGLAAARCAAAARGGCIAQLCVSMRASITGCPVASVSVATGCWHTDH
jgi:hypothetical protein